MLAQIDRGEYQELPDISFEELAAKFLESQRARVREKTYLGYRGHLEGRLIGYFKGRKVKTIRPVDVESFLASMAQEGVSAATTAKHLGTLKMLLKRATQWGYLTRSPAEHVRPPRIPQKEMDFLSPEEMQLLIEATEERYRPLIMCACLTGMRQGEILGLQWGDIDLRAQESLSAGLVRGAGSMSLKAPIPGGRSSFLTPCLRPLKSTRCASLWRGRPRIRTWFSRVWRGGPWIPTRSFATFSGRLWPGRDSGGSVSMI
ncbi:MAG: putative defective protein IntQ [Actinobacteria bacterium]|uniref:Core-binding (CB) domain-containing protein n=1 Tax=Candidatus Hakubella thermalkaliphila TaxID=2754717 RepID=A0A6V8PED1_9ACTN|nr:putative defective protein IntQ [Actinomycetota bacterium]GFP31089.1 hypothetical protein HKBW3S34_02008 [Candidatus Hakubella thermalkaliphila]GFP39081.1 hypothetical protein HKBW3S47_00781 [Candidatus Hakubella thermalkaliphila]GFP43376.1 hypothetical protein HKBW3C_02506 [Candidatus Hakubella thermalkaliphila]